MKLKSESDMTPSFMCWGNVVAKDIYWNAGLEIVAMTLIADEQELGLTYFNLLELII